MILRWEPAMYRNARQAQVADCDSGRYYVKRISARGFYAGLNGKVLRSKPFPTMQLAKEACEAHAQGKELT